MRRLILGTVVLCALVALQLVLRAGPAAAAASHMADYNGDGFADIAIGVPFEDVAGLADAGAVTVIYGSAGGLSAVHSQLWTQRTAGVAGTAAAGDLFGSPLSAGDFDHDGFADLAIGVRREDEGGATNAGGVEVLYGSPSGLTAARSRLFTQSTPDVAGVAEAAESFGAALSQSDLNGDGFSDLAVGVPFDRVGAAGPAGAVDVLYGSAAGLVAAGSQLFTQDSPGVADVAERGDHFGSPLAARDVNGDGFDDLAVSAQREDLAAGEDAGAVHVLFGSAAGLSGAGSRFLTQDTPGLPDAAEAGDRFGDTLSVGDYDGDGFADLVVAVPFEDIGTVVNTGAVEVVYGSAMGLRPARSQLWHQDSPGIVDTNERGDFFGANLDTGDFDGDGRSDLAIGVGESLADAKDAGAVTVIYGAAGGLAAAGNQFWSQDSPGVKDVAEPVDRFASGLSPDDFDGDGFDDLAIGVREEDVGSAVDAGALNVLYGSGTGLGAARNQLWTQDSPGILDSAEAGDFFGAALGEAAGT